MLLCCRNGQPDILSLFLNYVEPEFVNRKAQIDGFNAIFACVEANRPECIGVLKDYGIDLEQFTDADNQILPGATPLHLAAYYGRTDAARKLIELGANVNSIDINGQTPLHIAVFQGQLSIISLLRNSKADLTVRDKLGNTAASYCRNRSEIRDVLVNPALDVLMRLAKGCFPKNEEGQACEVLARYSGVTGCFSPAEALDIAGPDGSTPLMQSVIYSNFHVAKALVDLGVNTRTLNSRGISCDFFAHWINNPRIKGLFGPLSSENAEALARLKARSVGEHSQCLFLGNKPAQPVDLATSGIGLRMDFTLSRTSSVEASEQHLFNAKLQTVSVLAGGLAGQVEVLTPAQIHAIALYANNPHTSAAMNNAIAVLSETRKMDSRSKQMIQTFVHGLMQIPPFVTNVITSDGGKLHSIVNECYIGCPQIDRSQFVIGSEVTFPSFVSAVTQWRLATENVPEFSTKKKEGVVFVIRSKTGRFIGQYSEFSFDCEVVFMPYARFKVINWYAGDIIALGQANIREHTFKIKSETDTEKWDGMVSGKNHNHDRMEAMIASNRSVIIELEELPRTTQLQIE